MSAVHALPEGYALQEGVPSVATYRHLRTASGLSPKSEAAAERGLAGTLHGAVVQRAGEVVGMARVIGDGGAFYQVVDVMLEPAHQGKGLGKALMAVLMDWFNATAPDTAYISLLADPPADALYAQFGFTPTAPASIGMAQKKKAAA